MKRIWTTKQLLALAAAVIFALAAFVLGNVFFSSWNGSVVVAVGLTVLALSFVAD